LEILDLIALLTVLMSPVNDVACVHVLRSPLFGFTDEDLIALNQCEEKTWWEKLSVFAREVENQKMLRAFTLLNQWREIAMYLPVHDLLDKILYEGEFVECYVAAAPNNLRMQMVGNIEAFIELSLSLEAGRYPSVPKFIDALKELKKGKEQDAPDEALVDVNVDAVQILTVHAAKGLEAAVVIVLDSNSFKPPDESYDILCAWPVGKSIPQHFSVYGKKSQRGCVRDKLFLEEEKLKEEENWNLLYVAFTRAKHVLILSGVADNKKENGINEDSWYGRMYQKEYELSLLDLDSLITTKENFYPSEECVQLSAFSPLDLSLTFNQQEEVEHSSVIEEGVVLHALLERITVLPVWPIIVPEPDLVKNWLTCSYELAQWACSQVKIILSEESLRCFFDYQLYDVAHNEMDIIEGELLHRLDRVVVFEKEVWILDYKRQFLESEEGAYQAQLARYRNALEKVFINKVIRTALILFSGELVEIKKSNDTF
jgi:ATP-dependent helicase/nuclease subunit A